MASLAWTPVIADQTGAGSATYVKQLGDYSVNGNQVVCNFCLEFSGLSLVNSVSSPGAALEITGLPVAIGNVAPITVGGNGFASFNSISIPGGGSGLAIIPTLGTTTAVLVCPGGSAGQQPLNASMLSAAPSGAQDVVSIRGTIVYVTS